MSYINGKQSLKACVNEVDNTQEKYEKSWGGIEIDYLENI